MKVLDKQQIIAHFDAERATRRIEEGFIAFSKGQVQVPPVQAFAFAKANGDCCVKSAYMEGSKTFTVKVATGFYDNPSKGLPSNDGLMMVFCAHTGQPLALLKDEGWLTGIRTALAGRLAARLLAPRHVRAIGMLGTGEQARMQLEQLMSVTDCRQVIVWGRSEEGVEAYRQFASTLGFVVHTAASPEDIARGANLIVCATPSREPLLKSDWLQPGTHITAVGADAVGKRPGDDAARDHDHQPRQWQKAETERTVSGTQRPRGDARAEQQRQHQGDDAGDPDEIQQLLARVVRRRRRLGKQAQPAAG